MRTISAASLRGRPTGPRKTTSEADRLRRAFPAFYGWAQAHRGGSVLVLPMPTNIANARLAWWAKNEAKKVYFGQLDTLLAHSLIPVPPATPPARVIIAVRLVLSRPMDDDNAMNRGKWWQDWLVRRGYLAGDAREQLRWAGLPEQVIAARETSRVEIEIREVRP